MTEIEVMRYLPRGLLTRLISRCDLIQVVSGTAMSGFAVAHLPKPICLTVATLIRKDRQSALSSARGLRWAWKSGNTALDVMIEREVLLRMDHVFAISKYTKTLLEQFVTDDRLSLACPGIDTTIFRGEGYRQDGYIFTVGRFSDPRKNTRMLFRAYHRLRQDLPNAPRLVLAGSSAPTSEDWMLARELGIAQYVQFQKGLSVEALAQMYRGASLFVLSSDEEGFGIVLTEAMASGLPIVSTRCGGPETVVADGETGLLTPIGDPEAMAVRMRELLTAPALRVRMSEAARRTAVQRFSLESTGAAYLAVYDQILDAQSRCTAEHEQRSWDSREEAV